MSTMYLCSAASQWSTSRCLRAVWPGLSVSVDGSALMCHPCYYYKLHECSSEQENTLGCWLPFPHIPLIHSIHYGDFDLPSEDTTSRCALTLRSVTACVSILNHAWMIMFVIITEWNQRLVVSSKTAVAGINEKKWHHLSVISKSKCRLKWEKYIGDSRIIPWKRSENLDVSLIIRNSIFLQVQATCSWYNKPANYRADFKDSLVYSRTFPLFPGRKDTLPSSFHSDVVQTQQYSSLVACSTV